MVMNDKEKPADVKVMHPHRAIQDATAKLALARVPHIPGGQKLRQGSGRLELAKAHC